MNTMTLDQIRWCLSYSQKESKHFAAGTLLSMLMPNGKTLGESTGEECEEVAELLKKFAAVMLAPRDASHAHN